MGCACSASWPLADAPCDNALAASSNDSVVGHGRAALYRGPAVDTQLDARRPPGDRGSGDESLRYATGRATNASDDAKSSHPHVVEESASEDSAGSGRTTVMEGFEMVARVGHAAASVDWGGADGVNVRLPPPRIRS